LYYRRENEKPIIFPSIKKARLSKPLPVSEQVAVPPASGATALASFAAVSSTAPSSNGHKRQGRSRTEGLLSPNPSASCKGACLDRYYSTLADIPNGRNEHFTMSPAEIYNVFQPRSALPPIIDPRELKAVTPNTKVIGFKKEYMEAGAPLTIAKAYQLFQPKHQTTGIEYMALFSSDAHMSRIESLTDMQIYDAFQPGSAMPTLVLTSRSTGAKEYLGPNDKITLSQAYKLFEPKDVLTQKKALAMVEQMSSGAQNQSLTIGAAYRLFQPKTHLSIEHMKAIPQVDMNKLGQLF
jgi:hypothetical protein